MNDKAPGIGRLLFNGLFKENPVFRLALSMCPAVGVTTTVRNGFLLGLAVLFVQVASNVTVALLRRFIHPRIRIPAFIIIIATWVSVIDMILAAYVPTFYKEVALYVKLIVVFAIIISRLEVFASRYPVWPSLWDGVGMGLGFMFGLMLTGFVRELFGAGTVWGYEVLPGRVLFFLALPPAGFFTIGFLMALFNWVEKQYLRWRSR
ncbi:electron transport complex subunit RsxE [Thermosulfuriphilus ammonigenes]|uniref:Electron transport complex subunit RsxE n=1 Tax=Thermosulfuriphilus ammonigenes TaxID=1936021 RepID=A0A6G7PSX7_9BACT|nr:electron transport complex subunit RsxE [Thermosulfuriphilus ammonigenes]MBA2849162.1 electron transport complex protein RnfE [Thermosulfuriphilus ammonigenes]QIJ70779.1 electron transport complex subunit RsxE [Thermosulfuriphilus ammonigenes]HFB83226.1 electron transport complex subunit RsxE [Thermodesulfatator sp.]